jgi:hypothetical protein
MTVYECTALIGGGANALDAISVVDLNDEDLAFVTANAKFYIFRFNATATDAENTSTHPYKVRPDDYVDQGVWEEYMAATS